MLEETEAENNVHLDPLSKDTDDIDDTGDADSLHPDNQHIPAEYKELIELRDKKLDPALLVSYISTYIHTHR